MEVENEDQVSSFEYNELGINQSQAELEIRRDCRSKKSNHPNKKHCNTQHKVMHERTQEEMISWTRLKRAPGMPFPHEQGRGHQPYQTHSYMRCTA